MILMEDDYLIKWDMSELGEYFNYYFWKARDGLAVLAGFCYPYTGKMLIKIGQYDIDRCHSYSLYKVWEHSFH